ncbi:hypothetical protein JMJ35_009978 [Cladonia borealis]|uniref:Uncharacterized protein n=1 Tax=Cladonia borealis TaxID=184061 RepID=A0AA39QSV5_9LECA|nr:hypothetical protein JMJ35_009978 [Cladonia borealis]
MSGLNKFTSSFVSATNENTLALVNFNLDFALAKFEAPKEFSGLGTSLSTARRNNAEDGPLHKTLRKLGCLFEQILPSTPKLIQAYGLRTSEIIQSPGISPKGSRSHGPFEPFVGADGTSIWAAATSGPAALSVHLLACMLARQFDDSKIVSISTVMASQQEISREELAAFDASARAWLSSADEAKMSSQKKLMLILRNINTRISGGSSTYKTVIEAWKQAMIGLEDLLGGMPQEVSNGAVLRALSSWHLFPNLIVLVDKIVSVKFEDPLFPEQAVVTVGLQSSDREHDTGIQWSLTLSHLRYYGHPVAVKTDGNDSRVDMKQLHMVMFGSLLRLWSVPAEEVREVAEWFQVLWNALEVTVSKEVIASALPWLRTLVEIAEEILISQGDDWETSRLLVHYGTRRASRFLTEPTDTFRPFFGLGNPYVLATIELNIDYGVQYLRQAAVSFNLKDRDVFIMYSEPLEDDDYLEIATALKHTMPSWKRLEDGSIKGKQVHARWIYSVFSFPSASDPSCSCQGACSDNCPCRNAALFCGKACHSKGERACHARSLAMRLQQLADQGEEVFLIREGPINYVDHVNPKLGYKAYKWLSPPVLYGPATGLYCGATGGAASSISRCHCFENRKQEQGEVIYVRVAGFPEGFGLYAREPDYINNSHFNSPVENSQVEDMWCRGIEKDSMLQHLSGPKVELTRLFQFLGHIAGNDLLSAESRLTKLSTFLKNGRQHPASLSSLYRLRDLVSIPPSFIKSLQAISFANRLYDGMTAASIPLRLVEQPIYENHWIPQETQTQRGVLKQPSHAQAIACILTFESGGVRSDPKQLDLVMAISSRNSIFIAGTLLSDPAKVVKGADIKRVVGNLGKPGITLLVSPQNPLVKSPSRDFRLIMHANYDYQRLDSFSGTSLHLSFTKWTFPLNDGEYGLIDQDIFLAEVVVSVRDSGRWIADIDVVGARPEDYVFNIACQCNNRHESFSKSYISIDSWEELLDPPLAIGIFRAHGNWAARLAAICILKQKKVDGRVFLLDKDTACLACVENHTRVNGGETAFFID